MNSIRRPRRRARVRSVSFDVFCWVLLREAALRALYPRVVGSGAEPEYRASLCSVPSMALAARVRRRLNFQSRPWERF